MKKYNHSRSYYNKRYNKYKNEVSKIGGHVLTQNEFEAGYDALKGESSNILKDLIYGSKYGTSYNTALAEYRALKDAGIKGVKLESLKLGTTQDFAATYSAELSAAYSELRKQGKTGKDAKAIISQQWFGSK